MVYELENIQAGRGLQAPRLVVKMIMDWEAAGPLRVDREAKLELSSSQQALANKGSLSAAGV